MKRKIRVFSAAAAPDRPGQPDRLGGQVVADRLLLGVRASPFPFCASAISTCQPASSSRSCTKRAPFIDSIAARTGCAVPSDALA
jgi:hypothetical protein